MKTTFTLLIVLTCSAVVSCLAAAQPSSGNPPQDLAEAEPGRLREMQARWESNSMLSKE